MTMTFIKRSAKWSLIAGAIVCYSAIVFLWWHGYKAETFAQASFFNMWLGRVAAFGIFLSVSGGILKARLR